MTNQIKSIEALKKEAQNQGAEFFIRLKGCLRSTKHIVWDEEDRLFFIWNYIDDTEQKLTEAQLMDHEYTNIGYAMTRGALFKDDP